MIKIGNYTVNTKHFPDGTQCLMDFPPYMFTANSGFCGISWHYENDSEMITLMYLVNHIRRFYPRYPIFLSMPYIPNARMDRVKHDNEIFTLKYFADFINGLKFDEVHVFDPHSDVSCALINNIVIHSSERFIKDTIDDIRFKTNNGELIIYFPDAGAYKRYKDLTCFNDYKKIYGQKVRDWDTGQILGLKIVNEDGEEISKVAYGFDYETNGLNPEIKVSSSTVVPALQYKVILMVDDIISYGGTLHYSAVELEKLGSKNIYAFATHVEPKSIWNEEKGKVGKDLDSKLIKHLYTTSSIYNAKENKSVTVYMI